MPMGNINAAVTHEVVTNPSNRGLITVSSDRGPRVIPEAVDAVLVAVKFLRES